MLAAVLDLIDAMLMSEGDSNKCQIGGLGVQS